MEIVCFLLSFLFALAFIATTVHGSELDITMLMEVRKIIPAPRPHWVGDGFNVFPVFGNKAFTKDVSPFLMFDYAAPKHFPPTQKRLGVGQHPHRGFETVTIAFQGEVEHRDSTGNTGVIGSGDVQWMKAARGIIHEEFHSRNFAKSGGTFEMCQLWVNLPKKNKMDAPRYQPILKEQIPQVDLAADGEKGERCGQKVGHIRVIAGEALGVKGPAMTHTPVNLWVIALNETLPVTLDLPEGHNTMVFARSGNIKVGAKSEIGPQGMALMSDTGTKLRLEAKGGPAQVLLLGGERIDEPIAARGPFVMNTYDEIEKAWGDFHSGRLGR